MPEQDRQVDPRQARVSAWIPLQEHLEAVRRRLLEDIACYPTPIAGCDQQFNYLLEQRDGLADELRRLNAAKMEFLVSEHPTEVVATFIRGSRFVDDASGQFIRLHVSQALSAPQE